MENRPNSEKSGFNTAQEIKRLHITLSGAVQGVGFRPFIYRLATNLKLCGWVSNTAQRVEMELEG